MLQDHLKLFQALTPPVPAVVTAKIIEIETALAESCQPQSEYAAMARALLKSA